MICPNCGSTEYLEDYPVAGKTICANCFHEPVSLKLKVVQTYGKIARDCPSCGKKRENDDILLFDDDTLTFVYKCTKCEKLQGYSTLDAGGLERDDNDYDAFSAKIAQQEGKSVYTLSKAKDIARKLKRKERGPIQKCKKRLSLLIREKNPIMKSVGIGSRTINKAMLEAQFFIEKNGPYTEKQLRSILSAAIYLAQEALMRRGKILKKEITERQLKSLFDVDRKTIRKWKRNLKENRGTLRIGVKTRQMDGQSTYAIVEIPKEIASVIRLEKPYKDKCDFCEETKLLNWRIKYTNGSWSDICKSSFERLKDQSLEHEWEIEKVVKLP